MGEHRNLLKKADSNNQYLLKEVNNLRKERGMREVELNGINHQVNALSKDSKLARLAEEDLGHVIGLIDRGVSDGMLKVGVVKTQYHISPLHTTLSTSPSHLPPPAL